jgi:apolipoprotein N-acyltransferase
MNLLQTKSWVKSIFSHLGLVLLASLLFAASFPNPLIEKGFPFAAWFAYIPILIVIRKYNLLACIGWGAVYGLASYSLFNYWLGTFHPLAGTIVYSIYMVYIAAVFFFLKLADIFYKNKSYLVQWIIWLAYEYLKTKGFLGYSYGITGYSQWQIIPLIQIAGIAGVWGVSALVTFPSFWLAAAFKENNLPQTGTNRHELKTDKNNRFVWFVVNKIKIFFRNEKISAIVWAAALVAALCFGFINMKDFSGYPSAQIALIQHNTDPWEAARAPSPWHINQSYRNDLNNLIRLSDEALASYPKPQMVVWPETAFIPRIYWHTIYRDDQDSWFIVRQLLEYLSTKDVPFLIGNDDARIDHAKNPDPSRNHRIDYNAAMLFEDGINTQTYRKQHLVPFTEHFPYRSLFPRFYEWLKNADTHFWEKGDEMTVFQGPGFKFSVPICFEDTFGYISREFVRKGADVLVNITNDAWANSLSSQNQHLSMAVFRAVENYRPMVRSTTSGQTCAIDPNGRVTMEAAPFTETWLNVSIPLINQNVFTFYTLYGDYLAIFFTFTAVILLLFGSLWYTMRHSVSDGK